MNDKEIIKSVEKEGLSLKKFLSCNIEMKPVNDELLEEKKIIEYEEYIDANSET